MRISVIKHAFLSITRNDFSIAGCLRHEHNEAIESIYGRSTLNTAMTAASLFVPTVFLHATQAALFNAAWFVHNTKVQLLLLSLVARNGGVTLLSSWLNYRARCRHAQFFGRRHTLFRSGDVASASLATLRARQYRLVT